MKSQAKNRFIYYTTLYFLIVSPVRVIAILSGLPQEIVLKWEARTTVTWNIQSLQAILGSSTLSSRLYYVSNVSLTGFCINVKRSDMSSISSYVLCRLCVYLHSVVIIYWQWWWRPQVRILFVCRFQRSWPSCSLAGVGFRGMTAALPVHLTSIFDWETFNLITKIKSGQQLRDMIWNVKQLETKIH